MSATTKHSSSNLILTILRRLTLRPLRPLSSINLTSTILKHLKRLPFTASSTSPSISASLTAPSAFFRPASFFRLASILFYCLINFLILCSSLQALAQEASIQTSSQDLQASALHKTIGISQIVEHPALDEVRLGLIKALKEEGFVEGKNLDIHYENAQGNISTSSQIASKLLSSKLDLVVGISTPSAQTLFFAAQKQNHRIPIVFSAVSDPETAKLISSSYPITGVTDAPNLEGLLELIHSMMPNLKTLGLMYNPAEANSVSTITKLKKMLKEQGITAHEVTVNKTADVAQAMHSLIGKVDALYFPQDNTVVAAIETVVNIAQQSSPTLPVILPIFSNDPALIKRGILAAVGFDYHEVGKETGKVVSKILQGTDPNQIPIRNPSDLRAVVNLSLAKKLGLIVPTELKHSKLQFID